MPQSPRSRGRGSSSLQGVHIARIMWCSCVRQAARSHSCANISTLCVRPRRWTRQFLISNPEDKRRRARSKKRGRNADQEVVMRKISKLIGSVAVCLGARAVTGVAPVAAPGEQQQGAPPTDLSRSPLEAFAARSTAKTVWSKMIGRLESREARATITALILEDTTDTASVMRGLRIDLAHTVANPSCDWKYWAWRIMCQRANAAVYVEEGRLDAVRNGL